jgi:hypothetical protein
MQPAQQGGLQGLGLEAVEDTLEGVVRRDAVGQLQKALQPEAAFASEGFDIGPRVGTGEDGADSDGEDIGEEVTFAAVEAGVVKTANMLVQG